MRLDVFLHKTCLMKSRSMAGEACHRGKVLLDGAPARASRELHPGQRVVIDLGRGPLELEILQIPQGNVPKAKALEYYRVVSDRRGAGEEGF